jgi:asparagine synthase (glutamine-hydrolysing)
VRVAREPVLCLVDGRVRTGRLADWLGLDPAAPPARLVAEGYAVCGEAVVGRLDGEFALLLWDAGARRGLLARDRLGARPVFLAEHRGALLFASEVRNLLALLPSRPPPDRAAMARWLARAGVPEDGATLYAGMRALPGGATLRLAGGRWEAVRAWRPRLRPALDVDAAEAAAEVRRSLGAAVGRALEGAERPAVLLSGGLDSAAVAAASRDAGAAPVAYSGVFPARPEVDESDRLRRVRDRLGLAGIEAELGGGSALAGAVEFTRAWELPPVSPNRFVWAPLLRRAADDGVDVVLDGEGGDELLGCAAYLVADRLRAGRPIAAVRTARRLPGMGARPRPRWVGRALLTYGARGLLPPGLHERMRAARRRGGGGPGWLAQPVRDSRWAWKRRPGPRWWAHLSHVLVADPLGATDQRRREAALHGLDLRHPLRDPELIDLVLSLPPELAFDPDLDRPLLRRALAGELPDDVLRDTRKPFFDALLRDALSGPDADALRALVAEPPAELAALLRPGAAAALLDPAARPASWALDAWRVATLAIWLRHQEA